MSTTAKAPRIMLNPKTGIKTICIGSRKFTEGVKHAFNTATRKKFLGKVYYVGSKKMPMFIEVSADDEPSLDEGIAQGAQESGGAETKTPEQLLDADGASDSDEDFVDIE